MGVDCVQFREAGVRRLSFSEEWWAPEGVGARAGALSCRERGSRRASRVCTSSFHSLILRVGDGEGVGTGELRFADGSLAGLSKNL